MMKQFTILFFTVFLITIGISSYQQMSAGETTIVADSIEQKSVAVTKPDWQTIEGEGVNLSLPESYQGGNPIRNFNSIEEKLENLDGDYSDRLKPIQDNIEELALIAFDRNFSEDNLLTNVHILSHSLEQIPPMEQYLDQAASELESTHEFEQQDIEIINQNESPMGRILTTVTTDEGVEMKQLFYFHSQQEKMWITTYTTPVDEFQQRSANFEQSITSLNILPPQKEGDGGLL